MCDPFSLAVMGGTKIASNMLQQKAEKAVRKKREGAVNAAEGDIRKFTAAARKDYNKSVDAASPEGMAQAAEAARLARAASYDAMIEDPQAMVSDNASDAAKRAIVSALMQANTTSRNRAKARAAAEAYGAAGFGRDVTMGRAAGAIAQQADFAKGRTNVLDYELEAANSAGDKYANLAGLVDGLGAIGSAVAGVPEVQDFFRAPNAGTVIKNPNIPKTYYTLQ